MRMLPAVAALAGLGLIAACSAPPAAGYPASAAPRTVPATTAKARPAPSASFPLSLILVTFSHFSGRARTAGCIT
jgi:hypothetical protein